MPNLAAIASPWIPRFLQDGSKTVFGITDQLALNMLLENVSGAARRRLRRGGRGAERCVTSRCVVARRACAHLHPSLRIPPPPPPPLHTHTHTPRVLRAGKRVEAGCRPAGQPFNARAQRHAAPPPPARAAVCKRPRRVCAAPALEVGGWGCVWVGGRTAPPPLVLLSSCCPAGVRSTGPRPHKQPCPRPGGPVPAGTACSPTWCTPPSSASPRGSAATASAAASASLACGEGGRAGRRGGLLCLLLPCRDACWRQPDV